MDIYTSVHVVDGRGGEVDEALLAGEVDEVAKVNNLVDCGGKHSDELTLSLLREDNEAIFEEDDFLISMTRAGVDVTDDAGRDEDTNDSEENSSGSLSNNTTSTLSHLTRRF